MVGSEERRWYTVAEFGRGEKGMVFGVGSE